MIKLIPFEPEHIFQMKSYGGQDDLVDIYANGELAEMKVRGPSFTGILGNAIIGCAGFIELNSYRAMVWALFQQTNPKDFLQVHLIVRKKFRESPYKRIDAYVDPRLMFATRWIKQLGFVLETPYSPFYFPDGTGAAVWAYYPELN